jgi:hypothetical protein
MQADNKSCELLLRAIAQSAHKEIINRLALAVHDWDALLTLAREHRVLPMLFSRLADMGDVVPLPVAEQLQAENERNTLHSLANALELIALLKELDHEKIPAIPFKGVVLAAAIHSDFTARTAGDLDLLIHYKHLLQATAILFARGYELLTEVCADGTPARSDSYEYHFERPSDGMVTELRWKLELTEPRFRHKLGLDWVWKRRRSATLAGAKVPVMSPEITLLMLCMHGSKHAWSRLIWICDVAQLITSSPELDWKQVVLEAKRSGLKRTLALGVLLAHRVAGATLPPAVLLRFASDTVVSRLAQHFEDNLFNAPGSKPSGRIPYHIRLLDFQDRAWMFLSLNFLRPTARDREAVPLPKSLHFLHYLIRPFRILWDRSAR